MNPLEVEIRSLIENEGSLSVSDYMTICLTHPQYGYYTTRHPIGGKTPAAINSSDFITAPEVSQLFGEMIGIWCMEVWQTLGQPNPFSLVEIGPGRGTLMRDLLRISEALPGFLPAANIHLVEVSPTLTEQQRNTLSAAQITWITDISALPSQPTIMIGNEFLDALPFRQWVKVKQDWRERAIGLVDGELGFVIRPTNLNTNLLPSEHSAMPEGAIFETAPTREAFINQISSLFKAQTGAALLIDYGSTKPDFGDTFQAIKNHTYTNILSNPGKVDLTSHVDFSALVDVAEKSGCAVAPLATQGEFLVSLGLLEQAGNLGSNQSTAIQNELQIAVERLAAPDQMGELFKVLALGHPTPTTKKWPGFS